jgi:D-alanyl-D-alanine endopeptidase (penicillin-binding protein 7)
LYSSLRASQSSNKRKIYRVRKGDSLSLIAKKFKTSVRKLKRINRLRNNKIKVGQKIYLYSLKKIDTRPPSVGTQLGLRNTKSKIFLNSSAVLVINQLSGEVVLEKNPDAVLPIASITKLMTALVILEKNMVLSEKIRINQADARLERYNRSRLAVGSRFTRGDLLHLALMSSENRAAHALARTYPGGVNGFVKAMNAKAKLLGMWSTVFTEPTGLNSGNVSSPRDLIRLVDEASRLPLVREYSTSVKHLVRIRNRTHKFRNSNALARGEVWDLGVSKTGFIRDSGRCLVMQAFIDKSPVIIVMLDAEGNNKRRRDAEKIKNWILKANTDKKYFNKTIINRLQVLNAP